MDDKKTNEPDVKEQLAAMALQVQQVLGWLQDLKSAANELPGFGEQNDDVEFEEHEDVYPDTAGIDHQKTIAVSGADNCFTLYGFKDAADLTVACKKFNGTDYELVWDARGSPLPSTSGKGLQSAGMSNVAYADHAHEVVGTGLSVAYADSAGFASTADTAGYATTSGSAGSLTGWETMRHGDVGPDREILVKMV